jgi:hypothetical protein
VPGEYHASATCRSQCVAPPTPADSQVYEQSVGRDHFAGLSCIARRGRTSALVGCSSSSTWRLCPICPVIPSGVPAVRSARPVPRLDAGRCHRVPARAGTMRHQHGKRDAQPRGRRTTGRSRTITPADHRTGRTQLSAAAQSRSPDQRDHRKLPAHQPGQHHLVGRHPGLPGHRPQRVEPGRSPRVVELRPQRPVGTHVSTAQQRRVRHQREVPAAAPPPWSR